MSRQRQSLGPATREPGDPTRAEAIEFLACLASQPSSEFSTWSLPGKWRAPARSMASDEVSENWVLDLDWRENYAEAEARLRERKG